MEGKKSFVLYTDLMDIVNDLNDEQAGKLIKMVVDYVTDKDPKTDDQLINIAFKPIKNQLKRDLQKWETIKEKRSEAGKKGGRPKKQTEANKPNAFFEKQTEAKKAVNVNVNDNVNDINNRAFIADLNTDEKKWVETFQNVLLKRPKSVEEVLMASKLPDLEQGTKNRVWEAFIENAKMHTPLITDEKHAFNIWKKYMVEGKWKDTLNATNKIDYYSPSKIKNNWW